ncbi:MAG: electron transport complex subunit RsxC [Spirochaetales bacterium]|nr:electron transport complex subunit RsxC [Spirochaetales bacterium]
MIKVKSFGRGGVHPSGYKKLANSKSIKRLVYSGNYIVPMSQHLGAPAQCLVSVGDEIKEYQLIGEAAGFISANVHSPVTGKVVGLRQISLPNGAVSNAVEIEPDKDFIDNMSSQQNDNSDFNLDEMPSEILIEKIKAAGIVGMGGATFPANVKLSVPKGKNCTDLIINGVECEPFLCADHRLMLEKGDQIFKGIEILKKILNPDNISIGIENNKKDAIANFININAEKGVGCNIQPLKVKYPQGDEKQLIKAIMGKELPSGALPIDLGAVVLNVSTVHAIYDLFYNGKALVERVVTVTGDAIANPSNFLVRVGVPYSFLIEQAGGFVDEVKKIVSGGPMMGFAVLDTSVPITKGSGGILCLSKSIVRDKHTTNCLSCGRCLNACPMGLSPAMLYKLIDSGKYGPAMKMGLMDCKECGCCSYVCPAAIPLVQGFKLGKRMGRK